MKHVLIITDSLGLPRPEPEVVSGKETWPQLLRENFEVIQLSLGGATIEDLYKQTHYYLPFKPELVIIQAGIVDCAPRALSKMETINLNNFYITRGVLSKIMPRFGATLRKFRNKVYTPLPEFEKYLQKMVTRFAPAPVYWIGIVPAMPAYEAKVKGITTNINLYNQVLLKTFQERFIDLSKMPAQGIASDFHHLNVTGNKLLADKIMEKMR